jgi:pimeloyl-ACP methyl ester carboxylesterase
MTLAAATAPSMAPPSLALALGEAFAAFEWSSAAGLPNWLLWQEAPRGEGQPVLVIPGLLTDDSGTQPLRQVLQRLGYRVQGWGQGSNRGPSERVMAGLVQRLETLAEHGPVTLVGWSLGGAMAYALAAQCPQWVRQVITLSAPLTGDTRATHAAQTYALATGSLSAEADLHALLAKVPEAPITAISTRQDGVIAWPAAMVAEGHQRENLLVRTTHWGLPANAQTIWVVAQRLAQPAGTWRPYVPDQDDSAWLPNTEVVTV